MPDRSTPSLKDPELYEKLRDDGASKQKGRLRLDTPDGIATVTVAGDPSKSEMFRRISLPQGDFDIMPPEGEPIGETVFEAPVERLLREVPQPLRSTA